MYLRHSSNNWGERAKVPKRGKGVRGAEKMQWQGRRGEEENAMGTQQWQKLVDP